MTSNDVFAGFWSGILNCAMIQDSFDIYGNCTVNGPYLLRNHRTSIDYDDYHGYGFRCRPQATFNGKAFLSSVLGTTDQFNQAIVDAAGCTFNDDLAILGAVNLNDAQIKTILETKKKRLSMDLGRHWLVTTMKLPNVGDVRPYVYTQSCICREGGKEGRKEKKLPLA